MLACARCGAFAGGARAQLVAHACPRTRAELDGALDALFGGALGTDPLTAAACGRCDDDIAPAAAAVPAVAFCAAGCGEVYCSRACAVRAWGVGGHSLVCVGAHDEVPSNGVSHKNWLP